MVKARKMRNKQNMRRVRKLMLEKNTLNSLHKDSKDLKVKIKGELVAKRVEMTN